jgi:PAS domain S-box-containing protein
MQFNIFSLPVIVASLLMFITGIMIRPFRSTPGVGYFSLLLFSGALYSLFYALELSSHELHLIGTFYKLQYTGIPFIPAFFIIFAISYTRKIYIGHPALLSAIFLVPVLTAMFAFTKDMHDFFITGGHIDATEAFPVFIFLPGTWYWVHQVYSVTAFIAGIILLSRMYIFAAPAFRRQIGFILAGSVIPFIIYILYLARVFPQGLDANPFSFALTGIIIYTGISRFKLFSLFPLARNMLFESIPDSVFVLDKHSRLVDLNKSAANIFKIGPSDIGRYSDEVFGEWPEILSNITCNGNVRSFDISRNTDDGTVFLHCIFSPLVDKRKVERGQMLVVRDVSVQKKAEIEKFSSEEKFRIIFENAPVGLIYFNREGTIEHCNDYFSRLLGPGKKSVVGFNVMQFPDQRVTDAYNRVTQGQVAVFEGEYTPGTGKGTIVLQVVFKPLFDHLNAVEGGLCFVEDATRRRRTEESIRKTNEELKRINAEKDRFFQFLLMTCVVRFQHF